MPRTRIAPSPTGALHLGNARTFLVNWALARQHDWEIVLRIEDLDGPRVKVDSIEQTIDDLRWLGIDWDEGPYFQRADLQPYRHALDQLRSLGVAYRCDCTRKQIEAASLSAPHRDDHESRYPGTCRPNLSGSQYRANQSRTTDDASQAAFRLLVPDETVFCHDQFAGDHQSNVQQTVGDFLIWTRQGVPSYQLAVVVDDVRHRIDQVVRGDDLLNSVARQQFLYRLLELDPIPSYTHLPLVVGEDGRRLAKRHGDTRLVHYRNLGVTPQRIVGLIAQWCGITPREELSAAEFLVAFDLARIPKSCCVFSQEDDRWLTGNH